MSRSYEAEADRIEADARAREAVRLAAEVGNVIQMKPAAVKRDTLDVSGPSESGGCDEVARLSKLSAAGYERERKKAAARLGMRTSVLDALVKADRPADEKDMQGRALELPEPAQWPEPVNGAELLSEISAAIARHVILPATSADVVALWCIYTHAVDAFTISPRLAIKSPVKGCGKTTLMDSVACLVWRPLPTANATIAGIFRAVEMARPTLLLDEAERFVTNDHNELIGVLNSGHRQGGNVLRTVGEDNAPRMFSTFSACAFALIGKLPDTLEDRSVAIELRRRTSTEPVQPFRLDRTEHLHTLARKAVRWAADNLDALREADPDVGKLFNRVADNWRPLLAIADAAGGDWPKRARTASEVAADKSSDDSIGIELLGDIKAIFEEKKADRISSADLADALARIEGRPWAEWGRSGKPITQNALARQLKKFHTLGDIPIAPDTIRTGDHTFKGYQRDQFADAFARYLAETPPFTTVTP